MAIFTNQARLTYSGLSVNSNIVTGELREDITLSKTALRGVYRTGDTIVYAVSILNTGLTPLADLTVSDDLGGYEFGQDILYPLSYVEGSLRYYVNGVLRPAPDVSAGPPLVISGIDLPAGANAMLLYESVVSEFASPEAGAAIENTVTLSGGDLNAPIVAGERIVSQSGPLLFISKSLSPLTVSENERLTYTFLIGNNGADGAEEGDMVSITDIFDPRLSDLDVRLNGVPFTDYSYDPASGVLTTIPGAITVPGASFSQNPVSGSWQTNPGVTTLVVSGTV